MNVRNTVIGFFVLSLLMFGCKQESTVFPDGGGGTSGGGCGTSYPAGPYGLEESNTFACYSWFANVRTGDYSAPTPMLLDMRTLKARYDMGDFGSIREDFGFSNDKVDPQFLVFVNIADS